MMLLHLNGEQTIKISDIFEFGISLPDLAYCGSFNGGPVDVGNGCH